MVVGVQQDEQRESEKRGFIVCLGFFFERSGSVVLFHVVAFIVLYINF